MQPASFPVRENNLMDYRQILVRRRWTVLTFFIVCNVTVILGTFLATPLYRAEAKILIEGESANMLHAEESPAGNSLDLFENYLETQLARFTHDVSNLLYHSASNTSRTHSKTLSRSES
jgi:uncharacterized protein involved in exopolysaccharide biosynthesis